MARGELPLNLTNAPTVGREASEVIFSVLCPNPWYRVVSGLKT
jgi:hypothetical protein